MLQGTCLVDIHTCIQASNLNLFNSCLRRPPFYEQELAHYTSASLTQVEHTPSKPYMYIVYTLVLHMQYVFADRARHGPKISTEKNQNYVE